MMNLKGLRFCMHGALLLSIVFLGAGTHAQDEQPMMIKSQSGVPLDSEVDWEMCRPDGIAVGGYDPVSYRQPDGPVPGNAEFSAEHAGATYLFASESSLQKFLQNPDRSPALITQISKSRTINSCCSKLRVLRTAARSGTATRQNFGNALTIISIA
jgi:YHS domain-containing protein